jgi:predicted nucleotidyltransferase
MTATKKNSLFGKTRQRILALLFSNSDRSYYLREIARLTGCGLGAVQNELDLLSRLGYLDREKKGKQLYFKVNHRNPVFAELKGFVVKSYGFAALLSQALLTLKHKIEVAFIYGSFATGSESADSDIDFIVVGETSLHDVVLATMSVREYLARDLCPIVMSPEEFSERMSSENHFLLHILRGPKMFLIGGDDELERLGGEGIH